MTYLPWPWHSWQRLPATSLQSGQGTMMPLPGGVTVVVMSTSLDTGFLSECPTEVSGFGLSLSDPLQHCVCGRDRRLGRLDDSVATTFRQHVPGFAKVHLAGFLGGDAHGVAFIDLDLALAVVISDLAYLHRQLGLVGAEGEAEDVQGTLLALVRAEWLGFAGQFDGAVQARLYPHLGRLNAIGV